MYLCLQFLILQDFSVPLILKSMNDLLWFMVQPVIVVWQSLKLHPQILVGLEEWNTRQHQINGCWTKKLEISLGDRCTVKEYYYQYIQCACQQALVLCPGPPQNVAQFFPTRSVICENQPGLQCSDPLKSSPGSHSLLVSDSVGITSSCSLLAFPLSVSVVSSHLCCLCFLVSISNSELG